MNGPQKPIRSPSYPNMPLAEAIESIAKIEKLYRSSPVDRLSAAKLIGYKVLSGPANKALAALAAYGLLDRAGKGEARVTERARDILHANSEQERTARLFEAAMEPSLFRELRDRFEGIAVPPEDGVVTYLNRQGFNPNAVGPAAKAFLQTVSYLEEIGASESHGITQTDHAESGKPLTNQENAGMQQDHQFHKAQQQVLAKAGTIQEVFNLEEGPVTLIVPATLSAESYEDLEAQFELFLRRAKRRVGKTGEEAAN